MTLEEIRTCFPHTADTVYLNHAATSPLSRPVLNAVSSYLEQRNVSSIDNFEAFAPVVEETLERIARVIGTSQDRVEFAPNTSYALNVLAAGLEWAPGDRIAIPACEFPANDYPFMNLGRRGVVVDLIPHKGGTIPLDYIEQALTPQTRLLSISWVQFLSGYRSDLHAIGALCRDRDIIFCVDAIQGVGVLQLEVEECGIDFLACGAHKWLMGMQGTGFLYVTSELQDRLYPAAGWMHGPVSWENLCDYRLAFHETARRFRSGTLNNAGIAALNASVELYERVGPSWCEARAIALARRLGDGLADYGLIRYGGPDYDSGIVTIMHPEADRLHEHLQLHSIEGAVREKMLRFSPTYYNSTDEIDAAVEAVATFKKA